MMVGNLTLVSLMVDLHILEVRVGDIVEDLLVVHWTIEGITHWVGINVLLSRTNNWYIDTGLRFVWERFADYHVQLIGGTTMRSHW